MAYIFVHLASADADVRRIESAVTGALGDAGRTLLSGVDDHILEGALTPGRAWLVACEDGAAAATAAAGLEQAVSAAVPGAAADAGGFALLIEGNGAAISPAETAFLVANHTITDAGRFAPYAADVGRVTALFGGRFLARAGRTERIFGAIETGRTIILAFADRARAMQIYESPEYAPLLELRLATSRPTLILAGAGD